MSRTLDLLVDSNIHGTPDGYRAGCKTGHCPSPVLCRDVYVRYVGDYGFARRVDAGESPADIIAAEVADAEARAARDVAAARAESRREHEEHVAREQRKVPKPRVRKPKPVKEHKPTVVEQYGAEITRLNGQGCTDSMIAAKLELSLSTVQWARAKVLHLPRVARSIGAITPDRFDEVKALNAQKLSDLEIAARMGVDRQSVAKVRMRFDLPFYPSARGTGTPRPESSHLEDVRRAHGDGLSDGEIAARIGISKAWANALRNRLGLPANVKGKVRSFVEQPHGSFARYRSGCRCGDCRAANAAQSQKYRRAS